MKIVIIFEYLESRVLSDYPNRRVSDKWLEKSFDILGRVCKVTVISSKQT